LTVGEVSSMDRHAEPDLALAIGAMHFDQIEQAAGVLVENRHVPSVDRSIQLLARIDRIGSLNARLLMASR
jgi:hypothetical protein